MRQNEATVESWRFTLIPDTAPVIAFDGRPGRAVNGALEITFTVNDDYGTERAYAEILPVEEPSPDANALYDPPEYPLTLPRSGARERKARESRNLTEHPMAGMPVRITLVAEDSVGQTGRSETIEMGPARQVFPQSSGRVRCGTASGAGPRHQPGRPGDRSQ